MLGQDVIMIVGKSAAYKLACVRAFTGGSAETGLWSRHTSQLKVMHTNQWPIPYYRRVGVPRNLFPDNDYNVKIMNSEVAYTDEVNVAMAERFLRTTAWGQDVLETINVEGLPQGRKQTYLKSPSKTASIYMDDLLKHVHFARGENARILKKHKFASALD
jgi:hypothetical protein